MALASEVLRGDAEKQELFREEFTTSQDREQVSRKVVARSRASNLMTNVRALGTIAGWRSRSRPFLVGKGSFDDASNQPGTGIHLRVADPGAATQVYAGRALFVLAVLIGLATAWYGAGGGSSPVMTGRPAIDIADPGAHRREVLLRHGRHPARDGAAGVAGRDSRGHLSRPRSGDLLRSSPRPTSPTPRLSSASWVRGWRRSWASWPAGCR